MQGNEIELDKETTPHIPENNFLDTGKGCVKAFIPQEK